ATRWSPSMTATAPTSRSNIVWIARSAVASTGTEAASESHISRIFIAHLLGPRSAEPSNASRQTSGKAGLYSLRQAPPGKILRKVLRRKFQAEVIGPKSSSGSANPARNAQNESRRLG